MITCHGETATMRASVLHGKHDIRLETVAVPELAADDVLVRIAAVGVCGSDVHYYREGRIGEYVIEAPLILGHEASGTIVRAGGGVDPSRIGERVSIEPQRPCRRCDQCKHGRYNLCIEMRFYATPPIDGAFAEYASIPADFAHPIPDTISWEAAALCEPLSVGIWANQKAGVGPGSTLLIAGAGPVGIAVLQTALAFGARHVAVSDPSSERRALAEAFGASITLDPLSGAISTTEVDAFIDASGAPTAIVSGIRAVRPAGRVILIGMGPEEVMVPLQTIQNRELLISGVFRYAHTWPIAIELITSGKVDLDRMVSRRYGLDEVETALATAGAPTVMKNIVLPQS